MNHGGLNNMKTILLLLTFNVFAMYEVKVKNNANNKEFYGKFKTIEQVNEWIEDNKKPIKCEDEAP